MRLAAFGGWCLIVMLLARILAPIAIVYILPNTAAADEATRLILYTADFSVVMLLIAVLLLWAIKRQWRPGIWLGMALSFALLVWCGDALFGLLLSLGERPLSRGNVLLPPLPQPTTFLEGLASLVTAANTTSLMMILSLLFPSVLLVFGLGKNLFGRNGSNP